MEVILDERVLGVVAAADHARADVLATRARGTFAAEVGIGNRLAFVTEKDADLGWAKRTALSQLFRDRFQRAVGGPFARIRGHAQHSARRVVMRTKEGLPIGEIAPRRRIEQLIARFQEDVAVPQTAAADAAAVENQHAVEERHFQDAETAQRGQPQILPDDPVATREILVAVALAALQHEHAVALFRQTHRGNAAAESGANHHIVERF